MLWKLWRIKEITHPNRRGVLWMIGGAFLNPSVSIAWGDQVSETIWAKVPIFIDDSWDVSWLSQIAEKAAWNSNVIWNLSEALSQSFVSKTPTAPKSNTVLWIQEWLHETYNAHVLELHTKAREAIDSLPSELQTQMGGQVLLTPHTPFTFDDIVNFPDRVFSNSEFQDLDICWLVYDFPEVILGDISMDTMMEFWEEGISFYFEAYKKVKGWYISHGFFEKDPLKVSKIRTLWAQELSDLIEQEGDFVPEWRQDIWETNKNMWKYKNSTYLTPVDFCKNWFSDRIFNEMNLQWNQK